MSGGAACRCPEREKPVSERAWVVTKYKYNESAFNGYHITSSDYSTVRCDECHRSWRTAAAYVEEL